MAASEAAPRVALLARAGEACERITGALREAGAEVVLVADPLQAEPHEVRQATPQAILVALDPAIEDAIDRYADVLADPDYMVIFEEAEQAAQRTGWDAARWLRHLSAKLHRHNDVLPAGAEAEESLLPTPGPLPPTAAKVDYEEAIAAVTDEAQQRAGDVPRDSGIDGLTGLGTMELESTAPPPAPPAVVAPSWDLEGGEAPASDALAPAEGDAEAVLDGASDGSSDTDSDAGSDSSSDAISGSDPSILTFSLDGDDAGADEPTFDPERFGRAEQAAEGAGGIEEFLAAQLGQASQQDDNPGIATADDASIAASDEPDEAVPGALEFSGLSLADDDAVPPTSAQVQGGPATPAFDLDRLGGGLSLADPDSYGHGPVRGAVVIEAGLGGPDAVRQLLAAIPEGFARPILIRLALDGGRYDRLVKQMTRVTPAPVSVAEDGQAAQPGHVYFVPPGMGLRQRGGWQFDASTGFDLAALPAHDSAVLLLSGADASLAATVTGPDWSAGLVLGQTPDENCYDPAAAQAAIAAGADHGTPGALAARLLARWPAADAAPDPDPSGMLQP